MLRGSFNLAVSGEAEIPPVAVQGFSEIAGSRFLGSRRLKAPPDNLRSLRSCGPSSLDCVGGAPIPPLGPGHFFLPPMYSQHQRRNLSGIVNAPGLAQPRMAPRNDSLGKATSF